MDIRIQQLKKSFGSKIAVDIDRYEIPQGTLLGLVGNNGAGKTTLFRLILDLLKADEGVVSLGNIPVTDTEEWKTTTGAYIDESFLIDYLTPEEYFAFLGKVNNLQKETIDSRINTYLPLIEEEILGQKKFIRNLSAGNKQKVGIIGAMIHTPQLLILDEPFNFLDPSSQNYMKYILQKYNAETGATILVSSHNLNHISEICPRIALMEKGLLIRDIVNTNGSAEKELEDYFNIRFEEK